MPIIEVVQRIEVPDIPDLDLPYDDGEPLESNWHRLQINLLGDALRQHWPKRTDFFAGGNMFVYYSLEQARTRDYKGPDFFVVLGVDGTRPRETDADVRTRSLGPYPLCSCAESTCNAPQTHVLQSQTRPLTLLHGTLVPPYHTLARETHVGIDVRSVSGYNIGYA